MENTVKNAPKKFGCYGYSEDGRRDHHHLLWPRSAWSVEYAHLLRNDPYYNLIIPKVKLHCAIHRDLPSGIPVPDQDICQDAYDRLNYARRHGSISILNDPPEKRLNFLIHLWYHHAPETISALERQIALFEDYESNLSPLESLMLPPRPLAFSLA